MTSSRDLKPCPFCGSAVEVTDVVSDYGIRCPKCGLILIEDSTDALISKWNQRKIDAVSIPAADLNQWAAMIKKSHVSNSRSVKLGYVWDAKITGIGRSLAIRLAKTGITSADRGLHVDLALSANSRTICVLGCIRTDYDGMPYVTVTSAARALKLARNDPVRIKLLNMSEWVD